MSEFKIGLFGNMNNNFFVLSRYLKKLGYHVTLLLNTGELDQFKPENDSFVPIDLEIRETKLRNAPTTFYHLDKEYIRSLVNEFDFCIGCGSAPAYFHKAGLKLDLFIPYGNDIQYMPIFRYDLKESIKKNIKRYFYSRNQKAGIREANKILMDPTNEDYEQIFSHLNLKSGQRDFCNMPVIFVDDFSPEKIETYYASSSLYPRFKSIRQENKLVVFSQCRHIWFDSRILTYDEATNGNQKLIQGFAKLVSENKNLKTKLVLFNYGKSVDKSKKLIQELGIEKHVEWFPLSPRKEIMIGISLCDIGVGELDSSYFSYGTIYEFLAMGKPVIHYRDDALYTNYYPEMYPMYSANTADGVYSYLASFLKAAPPFIETGLSARNWFLQNAIDRPLKIITSQINNKMSLSDRSQ